MFKIIIINIYYKWSVIRQSWLSSMYKLNGSQDIILEAKYKTNYTISLSFCLFILLASPLWIFLHNSCLPCLGNFKQKIQLLWNMSPHVPHRHNDWCVAGKDFTVKATMCVCVCFFFVICYNKLVTIMNKMLEKIKNSKRSQRTLKLD